MLDLIKRNPRTVAVLIFSIVGIAVIAISRFSANRPRIETRPPDPGDQLIIPMMRFSDSPASNVVAAVNDAVRLKSRGVVVLYIKLDTTPAPIRKFASNIDIDRRMDLMIATYRRHEERMVEMRALGYENTPYSGQIGGPNSLALRYSIREMANTTDLMYEERGDGIYMWRKPRHLECRGYRISRALLNLVEQKRHANDLHVAVEPVVSTFAQATGINSHRFTIPVSPNAWRGELHFDKVFQYLPDLGLVLVIGTPDEHTKAQARLKSSGLWADLIDGAKE